MTDTDNATQAEWITKLMDTYDVPTSLIRYESVE